MTEKTVKKALAGETISNGETIAESSDKPFYNNFFLTIQRDGAWVDRIQLPAVARIGRDADNQIRIANRLVSRHHCILRWTDGAWHITDLNSANGTYVNGDKVTNSQVNVGDAVSLGECQLRIEVTEQSDPVENHDSHPTVSELTRSVVEIEKVAIGRVFQESEFAASRSGDSSTYAGLYNLAVQLGRSQDAATHANLTLQRVLQLTKTDIGAVMLYENPSVPSTGEFPRTVAIASRSDEVYAPSANLSSKVLECGEGILAVDAGSLDEFKSASLMGAVSLICVPIRHENKILGLIHVYSEDTTRMLTSRELECCLAAADLMGASLRNCGFSQPIRKPNHSVQELASELIGVSNAVIRLRSLVKAAAESDYNVVVHGETGSGKSLVVKWIHRLSYCSDGPFVRFDCANLRQSEIDSPELLAKDHFQRAVGGTLFLDNVEKLSSEHQRQLVQLLDENSLSDLATGTPTNRPRIVSAMIQAPDDLLSQSQVLPELLFRLKEVEIRVPALRERTEDLRALITHFLDTKMPVDATRDVEISSATLQDLSSRRWLGNVRQFETFMTQKIIGAKATGKLDWSVDEDSQTPTSFIIDSTNLRPLAEAEKQYVAYVLSCEHGNKTKASKVLDISRSTLDRKINALGISD